MINYRNETEFVQVIAGQISRDVLTDAIEFIKDNFFPGDVFDYNDLADWASENGFIKNEQHEKDTTTYQ